MTVAEFITARLNDLEERYSGDRGWADGGRTCYECGTNQDEVLRQVTAMRAILTEHSLKVMSTGYEAGNPNCSACGAVDEDDAYYAVTWPCATVRALAAVWSDHPDYRQEWKP